jgi:hypothetical protein
MSKIYVFSEETLDQALEAWKTRQIEENPNNREKIETTVVAMGWFFNSAEVEQRKMIMTADR